MASRLFERVINTLVKEMVILPVKFICNGSSAPTTTGFKNKGVASIARTTTGVFTITLSDAYVDVESVQVTVRSTYATPVDCRPEVGACSASGKTYVITLRDSLGAVADFSAANLIQVNVLLVLRNSSL